jgi:hypothetical protein
MNKQRRRQVWEGPVEKYIRKVVVVPRHNLIRLVGRHGLAIRLQSNAPSSGDRQRQTVRLAVTSSAR